MWWFYTCKQAVWGVVIVMKPQENDQKRDKNNNVMKLTVTSLSAMVAETSTFPLDITKTRLQLHGESLSHSAARRTSAFQIAAKIVRNEGLVGLYKGLSPAIMRHLFYTPTRIVGYEHFRNAFVSSYDQELSFLNKALIGGSSGAVAQVFFYSSSISKLYSHITAAICVNPWAYICFRWFIKHWFTYT